jgi:hypothetical protein
MRQLGANAASTVATSNRHTDNSHGRNVRQQAVFTAEASHLIRSTSVHL